MGARTKGETHMTLRIALLGMIFGVLVASGGAGAADTPAAVGMVKVSQGSVSIERAGQQMEAPVGTEVHVGDRVHTGLNGSVGITLDDDTRLSAGPNSTLLISEFRFNSTTHDGSLIASLVKGTFSVVSGLIAKHSPSSVSFKTPTMTLGIRGTEFIVDVGGTWY